MNRNVVMRPGPWAVGGSFLLLAILLTAPAERIHATDLTLVLDDFSFFFFEGARVGEGLPAGAKIPLRISRISTNTWSVAIAADALDFPSVTYPSGRTVDWKLEKAATGTLALQDGEATCTIQAPLIAHVRGARQGVTLPLTFTTETASRAAEGVTASRQGVRADPKTGYLQLVAAGKSPTNAATAPGKPFYVVLSGRIEGLDGVLAP